MLGKILLQRRLRANAYIYNGDINKPYKMACLLEKKRLECALAIYAIKFLEEGAGND